MTTLSRLTVLVGVLSTAVACGGGGSNGAAASSESASTAAPQECVQVICNIIDDSSMPATFCTGQIQGVCTNGQCITCPAGQYDIVDCDTLEATYSASCTTNGDSGETDSDLEDTIDEVEEEIDEEDVADDTEE